MMCLNTGLLVCRQGTGRVDIIVDRRTRVRQGRYKQDGKKKILEMSQS